jgi:sugar/nucleoside kinase (ribokinase family)
MPKMGETMAALNFLATPGGKGANACTAGARLGSHNVFICKVN